MSKVDGNVDYMSLEELNGLCEAEGNIFFPRINDAQNLFCANHLFYACDIKKQNNGQVLNQISIISLT